MADGPNVREDLVQIGEVTTPINKPSDSSTNELVSSPTMSYVWVLCLPQN
jgi:hypothetical protein